MEVAKLQVLHAPRSTSYVFDAHKNCAVITKIITPVWSTRSIKGRYAKYQQC